MRKERGNNTIRSKRLRILSIALLFSLIFVSSITVAYAQTYTFQLKWGYGPTDSQFNYTEGIAVNGSGIVYVVDHFNNRIQVFTSTGAFVTKWGTTAAGSKDGQFSNPRGIAIDGEGNVYVTDFLNNRIQKSVTEVFHEI